MFVMVVCLAEIICCALGWCYYSSAALQGKLLKGCFSSAAALSASSHSVTVMQSIPEQGPQTSVPLLPQAPMLPLERRKFNPQTALAAAAAIVQHQLDIDIVDCLTVDYTEQALPGGRKGEVGR